jgi:hypothetical protein
LDSLASLQFETPSRSLQDPNAIARKSKARSRLTPNPSIERTSSGKLRLPAAAAHVETLGSMPTTKRPVFVSFALLAFGASGVLYLAADRALLLASVCSAAAVAIIAVVSWDEARGAMLGALATVLVTIVLFVSCEIASYALPSARDSWLTSRWVLMVLAAATLGGSTQATATLALGGFTRVGTVIGGFMCFVSVSVFCSLWLACSHGNCVQ